MGRKRKRPGGFEPDGVPVSASVKRQKNRHPTLSVENSAGHLVLGRYYPKVQTLRQYLLSKLPNSSKSRRRKIASLVCNPKDDDLKFRSAGNEDSDEKGDSQLATLLDSTLVAVGEVTASELICRTKDFEFFSQQLSSTVASSLGEGTVSQPEVCAGLLVIFLKSSLLGRRLIKLSSSFAPLFFIMQLLIVPQDCRLRRLATVQQDSTSHPQAFPSPLPWISAGKGHPSNGRGP